VTHLERRRGWATCTVSLAALLAVLGCQDGYPIEPTPCDRYCALGLKPECDELNPTACVVYCEASTFSHICPTEFDDWVACRKAYEQRLECSYGLVGTTEGCGREQRALTACANAHGYPSGAE